MFEIKLVKHQDVTDKDIKEVVDLKSKQWNFDLDKQIQWINSNIKDSDFHVLLLLDKKNVAYLNLIDIDLFMEGKVVKGLGVGNVCAIEKGQGYGFKLMEAANKIIIELNKVGLLFCKEPLLKYYSSLGWVELNLDEYEINCGNSKVMVFNTKDSVFVKYDGILF